MQQVVLPIKDSNVLRSCLRNQLTSTSATLSGIEVIHALRKKTRRELSLIGFSAVDELKAMVPA